MILHCHISSQHGRDFDVLSGATFSFTYNEELDSGSIIIAHLSDPMEGLAPYDWARVYSEDGAFDRTYLVDSYAEKLENIGVPYYEYTIELMSETKLLEKIQLPNRQWQHTLSRDGSEARKTIRQAITEVCSLYVPKIRVYDESASGNFRYEYLIDFSDIGDGFDVPLKDISLSQPTLRQCITAMMSQIGRLPRVTDRKLGYLDLRAEPEAMTLDGSFSYVQRSNSSDSYVTELMSHMDNVLDADNKTVSETLGFRDRENVFLKQTENLYLETRYPIYKVERLAIKTWMSGDIVISAKPRITTGNVNLYAGVVAASVVVRDGQKYAWISLSNTTGLTATVSDQHVSYFNVAGNSNAMRTGEYSGTIQGGSVPADPQTLQIEVGPMQSTDNGFTYLAKMTLSDGTEGWIWTRTWQGNAATFLYEVDITPLCVEESKRQLLDTDFMEMTNANITDVASLARYYYGTVGYRIGDKRISGWSSTYTYLPSDAWWDAVTTGGQTRTVTYIENISSKILSTIGSSDFSRTIERWLFGEYGEGVIGDDWSLSGAHPIKYDPSTGLWTATNNFAYWTFDVEYQPLNSASVRYSKGIDAPVRLSQLDSQRDAISSMDALSAHESQSVERLGNPVLSINQYATDINELKWIDERPLEYEGSTIFQCVYSFNFNGAAANYFGSKGYVLKDYFTSIATKYRAYQYVDYSQAITRKESEKAYVLVSKTEWLDRSEKVWLGALNGDYEDETKAGLLSPFGAESYPISVGYMSDSETYKNECSVLTYGASIVLNQEDFDNVSPGLRLLPNSEYGDIGGGVPQKWYMWSASAQEDRFIGWMGDISEIYAPVEINPSVSQQTLALSASQDLPRIDRYSDIPYVGEIETSYVTLIGGTLLGAPLQKKIYKDYGEILNQSLQFEWWNDDGSIEFGAYFADACAWKGTDWELVCVLNPEGKMKDSEYESNQETSSLDGIVTCDPAEMTVVIGRTPGKIRLCLTKDGMFRDVCDITCPRNTVYHVSIGDVRSVRSFEIDDIPYPIHEIDAV